MIVTGEGQGLLRELSSESQQNPLSFKLQQYQDKNNQKNLLFLREKVQQAANVGLLSKVGGKGIWRISELRGNKNALPNTRRTEEVGTSHEKFQIQHIQSPEKGSEILSIDVGREYQATRSISRGIHVEREDTEENRLGTHISRSVVYSEPQTPLIKTRVRLDSNRNETSTPTLNVVVANDRKSPKLEFRIEHELKQFCTSHTHETEQSGYFQKRLDPSFKQIQSLKSAMSLHGTWGGFLRCLHSKKSLLNMNAPPELKKSNPIDLIPLGEFPVQQLKLGQKALETAVQVKITEIQNRKTKLVRVANQHRRTQSCSSGLRPSQKQPEKDLDSHKQFLEYTNQKREIYSGLAHISTQLRTIQVIKGVQPKWQDKQTLQPKGSRMSASVCGTSRVVGESVESTTRSQKARTVKSWADIPRTSRAPRSLGEFSSPGSPTVGSFV